MIQITLLLKMSDPDISVSAAGPLYANLPFHLSSGEFSVPPPDRDMAAYFISQALSAAAARMISMATFPSISSTGADLEKSQTGWAKP